MLTNKLNLKCYELNETKELLTITKMYITTIFIIRLPFLLLLSLSLLLSLLLVLSVKPLWRICSFRQLSPAILVSHDFRRQIFARVFLFIFSSFWNLICSKKRSFVWNESMSKNIQISIFTGKCLWWRPFKYSCRYEGLQLFKKVTPSKMLSCETLFYRT